MDFVTKLMLVSLIILHTVIGGERRRTFHQHSPVGYESRRKEMKLCRSHLRAKTQRILSFPENSRLTFGKEKNEVLKGSLRDISSTQSNLDSVSVVWHQRFHTLYSDLFSYSIATDNSGNSYITTDNGIVKYSVNGDSLWSQESIQGIDISIDYAGNLYNYTDYGLQKVLPSGTILWSETSVGVTQTAFDLNNNIYFTGKQEVKDGYNFVIGKYKNNGVLQWSKNIVSYNYPQSSMISLDSAGNVYAAGLISPTINLTTFILNKYSASGSILWSKTIDSCESDGTILDKSGNVYACIYKDSIDTIIKYDLNGNVVWSKKTTCSYFGSDASGNIYGERDNNNGFEIIKYNPSGDSLWMVAQPGSAGVVYGVDFMSIDSVGNCIIGGTFYPDSVDQKVYLTKISSFGINEWLQIYDILKSDSYEGIAWMSLDGVGNIYITGYSYSDMLGTSVFTKKVDIYGITQWTKELINQGYVDDYSNCIAADSSGSVYIAGLTQGDYIASRVSKYNAEGTIVWSHDGYCHLRKWRWIKMVTCM